MPNVIATLASVFALLAGLFAAYNFFYKKQEGVVLEARIQQIELKGKQDRLDDQELAYVCRLNSMIKEWGLNRSVWPQEEVEREFRIKKKLERLREELRAMAKENLKDIHGGP